MEISIRDPLGLIDETVKALPLWMEEERAVLELVRNSVLNHFMWAYNSRPAEGHDCQKWDAVIKTIKGCGDKNG